jgi:hypothetical protein
MLNDLGLLIEVVIKVVCELLMYGLLLAVFASLVLYFIGYLVYAYLCWRSQR